MDPKGIVKFIFPDGTDSGDNITVEMMLRIIRRAQIGKAVGTIMIVLAGIGAGVVIGAIGFRVATTIYTKHKEKKEALNQVGGKEEA